MNVSPTKKWCVILFLFSLVTDLQRQTRTISLLTWINCSNIANCSYSSFFLFVAYFWDGIFILIFIPSLPPNLDIYLTQISSNSWSLCFLIIDILCIYVFICTYIFPNVASGVYITFPVLSRLPVWQWTVVSFSLFVCVNLYSLVLHHPAPI